LQFSVPRLKKMSPIHFLRTNLMKTKGLNEAHFLSLLQRALSRTTSDAQLATTIYAEVEREVRLTKDLESFEKFCEKGSLPNLAPETVAELKSELSAKFGEGNVTLTPDENEKIVAVEIWLPDRTVTSRVKVQAEGAEASEGDPKPGFVPFPVSLPEDPELVWVLARREDLAPEEATRALASIQEEFWATKNGQKLLRSRLERSFAEFVAHVPASALLESGLKRHYKQPESLKTLRLLAPAYTGINSSVQ
jgi:hypothetical protein